MRKLASIQKIEKVKSIKDADRIEKVKVLGWTVVVKKGDFKEGDLCVYFEIDSLLPDIPEFEFINKTEDHVLRKEKSRKLSTKKIRKTLSQGLVMPVSIVGKINKYYKDSNFSIGDEVTNALNVFKYEPPIKSQISGDIKGSFPSYVPRTEEIRIQSVPEILEEFYNKRCYISVKVDGTSATYAHNNNNNNEIDICSRNFSLKEPQNKAYNYYWAIEKKYNIIEKIKKYGNVALQGEICGPGIQKNRLDLKTIEFFLFDVYFIDENKYADYIQLLEIAIEMNLSLVSIINNNFIFNEETTIEYLLKLAEGKYFNTKNQREGIVIRPIKTIASEVLGKRLSIKVISNKFLLKNKD